MKRLVLRVAALGTVVVLGLFAIAQAQRGNADSAATTAGSGSGEKAPAEKRALPKIPSSRVVDVPTRLGNLPDEKLNPLRPEEENGLPTENPPRGLPAGASGDPGARPLPRPGQSAGGPVSDPFFGRRTDVPPGNSAVRPAAASEERSDRSGRANVPTPAVRPPDYDLGEAVLAETREPARVDADPTARQFDPPTADPPAGTSFAGSPLLPLNNLPQPPGIGDGQDSFSTGASGDLPQPRPLDDRDPYRATLRGGLGPVSPGGDGIGRPGGKQLEGPQSPQLTIRKSAPEEIQVGRPATFRLSVRNVGSVTAGGVQVRDLIPKGTQLVDTSPRALETAGGELVWDLGAIAPGDEVSVEMQVKPIVEGEIGSVATVTFHAQASVRTVATQPKLVVKTSAPEEVLTGEKFQLSIEVSNPGSGLARGVMLEEHVPPGLQHSEGSDLEYPIGDLAPGASRKIELTLLATGDGEVTNVLSVTGEDDLKAEHQLKLNVLAPKLDVSLVGSKRRFLERKATYKVRVENPGTAPAEQVELVVYLPSGLKFVSATHNGHYEEANRAVYWQLAELPTREADTLELVTLPVEPGQQKLRVRGTALKGIAVEQEHPVTIEGIAAIMFEVIDVNDPVEVGGEATFEIRVLNQGSKAASNVQLWVNLPPQMEVIDAQGPARYKVGRDPVRGTQIAFDPLPRLAPKADTTYRVRAKGLQPGDLRTIVQLRTDQMQAPVTKEESTQVFSDE